MPTIGEMIMRIAIGGLLGGLIGLERHLRAKEAGIRTHFLVGLGSALFMVISQFGFADVERFDAARVAAQVVSGMGFLGAGLIIFHKNSVRGLTTAAGIWVVSAIGLASGAGMFWIAAAAAVMAVVCLEALHYVMRSSDRHQMRIHFTASSGAAVQSVLQRFSRDLDSYSIEREDGAFRGTITLRINTRDYAGLFLTATRDLEGISLDRIEPVEE